MWVPQKQFSSLSLETMRKQSKAESKKSRESSSRWLVGWWEVLESVWTCVWVFAWQRTDVKGKGPAIRLQPLTGPEGSSRLRLPEFKTIGTWRW
jgi:hypothetical protein